MLLRTLLSCAYIVSLSTAFVNLKGTPDDRFSRNGELCGESTTTKENTRKLSLDLLKNLDSCSSRRQALKIIEEALACDDSSSSLFKSVKIPPGASAKGLSDSDLAIQTRTAGKRYKIMDLIETSGNKDADRASLGLLCTMVASTISSISVNQNLPGPEILRFIIVWILTFTPLFYVGYGIATPSELQSLLVSIQRAAFPGYRKRMIQHEGRFPTVH